MQNHAYSSANFGAVAGNEAAAWNAQTSTWHSVGLSGSSATTPVQILRVNGCFVVAGGSTAVWNAQNATWYTVGLSGSSSATPVQVAGTALPIAGGFNFDSLINSDDLAQWRIDFGQNAHSDADGDGDSVGADYLSWQRN